MSAFSGLANSIGTQLISLTDIQGVQARNAAIIAEARSRKEQESRARVQRAEAMDPLRIAEEQGYCPICMELPQVGDRMVKLSCGHELHHECGDGWAASMIEEEMEPKCPVCKQPYVITDTSFYEDPQQEEYRSVGSEASHQSATVFPWWLTVE